MVAPTEIEAYHRMNLLLCRVFVAGATVAVRPED